MDGIKGIDVSEWQGNIDWQKVKNAGIKFAMIRTSYGKRSLDKTYIANIEGAQAAGIDVGVYHYCYAKNIEDAKAEARHFINTIKPYTLSYPAVLDLEDPSQANLNKQLLPIWLLPLWKLSKMQAIFRCFMQTNIGWKLGLTTIG